MSEGSASASYLALCVCGVWIFWSAHDYIQERIFLAPGFPFGLFMAFSLQTSSFLLSLAYRGFAWVWELTTTSSEHDARLRVAFTDTGRQFCHSSRWRCGRVSYRRPC